MITGYRTFSTHVPIEDGLYDPCNPDTYLDVTGALIRHEYLDRPERSFFWLAELEVLYKEVDLLPLEQAGVAQLDMVQSYILPRAGDIYTTVDPDLYGFRNANVPLATRNATGEVLLTDEVQNVFRVSYDYRVFFFNHGIGANRRCLSIDAVRANDIDMFSRQSVLPEHTKKWIYHNHLIKKGMKLVQQRSDLISDPVLSI